MIAKKKCQKRPCAAWNVEIHKLKQEITVWSIYKNRKKKDLLTAALRARSETLGVTIKEECTVAEAKENIQRLRVLLYEKYKTASDRRDKELLNFANCAEDIGEDQKAKNI